MEWQLWWCHPRDPLKYGEIRVLVSGCDELAPFAAVSRLCRLAHMLFHDNLYTFGCTDLVGAAASLAAFVQSVDSVVSAACPALPRFEAVIAEVVGIVAELDIMLDSLADWMAPESVPTPLLQLPASSVLIRDPKGIALVRCGCIADFYVDCVVYYRIDGLAGAFCGKIVAISDLELFLLTCHIFGGCVPVSCETVRG